MVCISPDYNDDEGYHTPVEDIAQMEDVKVSERPTSQEHEFLDFKIDNEEEKVEDKINRASYKPEMWGDRQ